MSIVKSGTFDLSTDASHGFTFRFHWNGEYAGDVGTSIVSITKIEVLSTKYGGNWYPGGTIAINGVVIATMDYNNAKQFIPIYVASDEAWYAVSDMLTGYVSSWTSGVINSSNIIISVNIDLYNQSVHLSPKPAVNGTYSISFIDTEPEKPEPEATVMTPFEKKRYLTSLAIGFLLRKEIIKNKK